MKIYLDTSSLFKLYHYETGSEIIERTFINYHSNEIFLSELAKIEFESTIWKKVRMREIDELQAHVLMKSFESDYGKYSFVQIDGVIVEQARNLLSRYGKNGLRTLDSIQLSTALSLRTKAGLFVSTDKLLGFFLKEEALPT